MLVLFLLDPFRSAPFFLRGSEGRGGFAMLLLWFNVRTEEWQDLKDDLDGLDEPEVEEELGC